MQWFLVGVVSASMPSAWADGRGYEPRTVPVNAGVVMFNANDTLVRDVYTFYAMDRRTDLKPLGLSFRNPFAPAGTTRNQAAYWLVDVSRLNDNQLARYKILLISRTSWAGMTAETGMTAEIREKLRRFVDGWRRTVGGCAAGQGASGTLFFPEVAPVANTAAIQHREPEPSAATRLLHADPCRDGEHGACAGAGSAAAHSISVRTDPCCRL
jgi:hypothetical protein